MGAASQSAAHQRLSSPVPVSSPAAAGSRQSHPGASSHQASAAVGRRRVAQATPEGGAPRGAVSSGPYSGPGAQQDPDGTTAGVPASVGPSPGPNYSDSYARDDVAQGASAARPQGAEPAAAIAPASALPASASGAVAPGGPADLWEEAPRVSDALQDLLKSAFIHRSSVSVNGLLKLPTITHRGTTRVSCRTVSNVLGLRPRTSVPSELASTQYIRAVG